MAGISVAISLAIMIFIAMSLYPLNEFSTRPEYSLVVSFLPYLVSGAVSSYLVLRRVSERRVVDGLKIGLGAAGLGMIIALVLGTVKGGLWMILGFAVGGLFGVLVAKKQ